MHPVQTVLCVQMNLVTEIFFEKVSLGLPEWSTNSPMSEMYIQGWLSLLDLRCWMYAHPVIHPTDSIVQIKSNVI